MCVYIQLTNDNKENTSWEKEEVSVGGLKRIQEKNGGFHEVGFSRLLFYQLFIKKFKYCLGILIWYLNKGYAISFQEM